MVLSHYAARGAMLPVEIDTPTWRRDNFSEEANETGLRCTMDMIDEIRKNSHIREMKEGDLVFKQVVAPTRIGKLMPNWEGPYRGKIFLSHRAYKLEKMNGDPVPRTWNAVNLRHYYSLNMLVLFIYFFQYYRLRRAQNHAVACPVLYLCFQQLQIINNKRGMVALFPLQGHGFLTGRPIF